MNDQALREGRFVGGRPPYGQQLVEAGPHPNPDKAADGKRLRRLSLDPIAAPAVERVFDEHVHGGLGLYAIAEGVTRDEFPSPSGHNAERNHHRASSRCAGGKSAIRAILNNSRHTGRQVGNRRRRHEILVDVRDVALGHETVMRWNHESEWVWSSEQVNESIMDLDTFEAAERIRAAGAHPPTEPKRRKPSRRYALSGIVTCGLCSRRMQGQPNHGNTHYPCRFPSECAATAETDHPKTVYGQEGPMTAAVTSGSASCSTKTTSTRRAAFSPAPARSASRPRPERRRRARRW